MTTETERAYDSSEAESGTSVAHAWRWALYGRYVPSAPKGAGHKVIGTGFVAFLALLGQCADPDGVNRKPPGTTYISDAIRISRDSVGRYWRAAERLGVITVERSATGRYIYRYSLVTVPEWMLDWRSAEEALSGYKRLAERRGTAGQEPEPQHGESRRQDSHPQESESRRHDSPETAPETPSPDVRQGRVLTSGKASPDVMTRPGDDHAPDHEMAGVVVRPEVRAGARGEQPGIPVVEERIVPVPVTRRPLAERLRLRPDEELAHLVLTMRGHTLTAREQARYAEIVAQQQAAQGTVRA